MRRLTRLPVEPMPEVLPVEIGDLTSEQENSFNQKFIRSQIRDEIGAQNKLIKRARMNPRVPKTEREKQIRSYQNSEKSS